MDKALKQRLVGAVVLIALAVIVLPMLLGGRSSGGNVERPEIELPVEPRELDFETRKFPVGAQGTSSAANDGAQDSASADSRAAPDRLPLPRVEIPADSKPAEVEPLDGAEPDSSVSRAPDVSLPTLVDISESEQEAPGSDEGMEALVSEIMAATSQELGLRFVVQVASFGHSSNATKLSEQLRSAGYAVLLDNVSGDAGQLSRVRVGPYATEEEARRAVEDISSGFSGVTPRVVDLKPDETSEALVSDDPLMRWVVQVGTFSSSENAQKLVARLQSSGLSAYEETVRTQTAVMHRVRVGPFLDRSGALEAEQRVADETGIDGVVMSAH